MRGGRWSAQIGFWLEGGYGTSCNEEGGSFKGQLPCGSLVREASLPCSMDGFSSGSAVPLDVVAVCLEMKRKKCFWRGEWLGAISWEDGFYGMLSRGYGRMTKGVKGGNKVDTRWVIAWNANPTLYGA